MYRENNTNSNSLLDEKQITKIKENYNDLMDDPDDPVDGDEGPASWAVSADTSERSDSSSEYCNFIEYDYLKCSLINLNKKKKEELLINIIKAEHLSVEQYKKLDKNKIKKMKIIIRLLNLIFVEILILKMNR